jgi:hypothetical protein
MLEFILLLSLYESVTVESAHVVFTSYHHDYFTSYHHDYFTSSNTPELKRLPLRQRKSGLSFKPGDLLKEVQFI